ncbi:tetratricopeptide repeat protein [Aureispira anguillae]|uniref:Tetratricopeptide repeat protein n=1 Tax=Aureispira anguillae TaxID=2864201 RepID=A0A915YDS0_9BACT|nr:tetratricopeptide repeat protein [Aureispira anguillae]BDS11228.1 tetratricopeptide repeat protein [Aureispira anguillae]
MKSLIIIFLLIQVVAFSQGDYRAHLDADLAKKSDKKQQLIDLKKTEKDKIKRSIISNKLGLIYQKEGQLDSAYLLHQQALKLALADANHPEEIAISYNKIGIIHYYKGSYDSAAHFFDLSIPYYSTPTLKANSLNNLALMNKYKERPDLAIQNYLAALGIYKQEQLATQQIVVLNNIGALHYALKEDSLAILYHTQALDLALKTNNKEDEMTSKSNLANCYDLQKKYQQAISIYKEVLQYFEATHNNHLIVPSKNNLANCYSKLGNHQEALKNYLELLDFMGAERQFSNKEAILSNIGDCYIHLKKPQKALIYYQQALAFAQEYQIVLRYEPIYKGLAVVYKNLNNIDSSLYFKNKQLELRDSLDRVEKEKKMMELETKYQHRALTANLTKTQKKLADTTKAKSFFSKGFLIALCFILITIGLAAILYQRYLDKKELTEELRHNIASKNQEIEHLNHQQEKGKLPYPSIYSPLTKREKEVLQAVQEGLKDQEIADKLFLSVTTIRTHLRKAYSKIGVRNRAEATLFVTQYEL